MLSDAQILDVGSESTAAFRLGGRLLPKAQIESPAPPNNGKLVSAGSTDISMLAGSAAEGPQTDEDSLDRAISAGVENISEKPVNVAETGRVDESLKEGFPTATVTRVSYSDGHIAGSNLDKHVPFMPQRLVPP